MAYNINKLTDAYSVMTGEKKKPSQKKGPPYQQWKPSLTDEGKARVFNVRLLPYLDQNEQPFQEVNYYDNKEMNSYRLVAPAQFGLEDPIAEVVAELRKDRKNANAWSIIKPLLPKPRYFAPVFVREEPEKGVQVWELSPTVCKDIYGILVSEDYRDQDVTDPVAGYDLQVTVTSSGKVFKAPTGIEYPVNDIKVLARTKSTRLAKTDQEIDKIVSAIPDLKEIFIKQCNTADELRTMLESYLAGPATSSAPAKSHSSEKRGSDSSEPLNAKSVEEQFEGL